MNELREAASTIEDARLVNKEGEQIAKPDSHNLVLSEEAVPADLYSPGSSFYALGDILEPKNLPSSFSHEDFFEHAFGIGSQHSLDDRSVVEELTVTNVNSFNIPIVGTSRQNPEQCLYQSVSGSGSVSTFCGRDNTQPLPTVFENAAFSESLEKRTASDAHSLAVEELISRSKEVSGNKSKFLSKSGFSNFFARTSSKGKGILCRAQPHDSLRTESGGPPVGHISKPSPRNGDCNSDGVSLRYWLKFECSKASKPERLLLFKQIVDLVDSSHSQGVVLHDLKPSFFKFLLSNQIKYVGANVQVKKNHQDIQDFRPSENYLPMEEGTAKKRKLNENLKRWPLVQDTQFSQDGLFRAQQQSAFVNERLEDRWYESPEELNDGVRTISSNVYNLGVLLFELLCHFDSEGARAAAMLDLRHRIFPPSFLSENLKEAGFCLQLLHPEPLLRPSTRDILRSEVMNGFQEVLAKISSVEEEEAESELLHHFLVSLNEQKQKHASKLMEDIECLESDIKELEKRRRSKNSSVLDRPLSISESCVTGNGTKLMENIDKLENAYFSMRSKIKVCETGSVTRPDKDVLQTPEIWSSAQKDCVGAFFDGLCKYARYSRFEVRGLLRSGEFSNLANVICSLGFDRDEEYFAAAGVSRKIKVFEFNACFDEGVDIHYPVIEMVNKSKVSCVCWNSYVKGFLASTDYDGVVKLWDANTGQVVNHYIGHETRAWSVDFSRVYPTKFASCSDDYSVKLWCINEQNTLGTIKNVANLCCVQFSPHSSHMLAFGSADCKTYCYDLRNARFPWCVLSGHSKAVSYVKFLDSETLVTASTDNTLKLWDLTKSSSSGPSTSACSSTFTGHTNEKNFVGLSVADGFIACGSESNEVYSYHRSLPMPITSHKFGSIDPISGNQTDDDNGLFVSSVCWKGNSDMLLAANSTGCIKVLQMV